MTGSIWQTAIVVGALSISIAYLIRVALKKRRAQSACANCPAIKAGRR